MNAFWGTATKRLLEPLKRLQNKAIKIIRKLPYLHPTHDLFSTRVLSLESIYLYESIIIIFKIKNGLLKCNTHFPIMSNIHSYNTRNQYNFQIPIVRSNLASKNVFLVGLQMFNRLPLNLKKEKTCQIFKLKLKKFIFHNSNSLSIMY